MDKAIKNLTTLLKQGHITPETYAEGVAASSNSKPTHKQSRPAEAPTKSELMRKQREETLCKELTARHNELAALRAPSEKSTRKQRRKKAD